MATIIERLNEDIKTAMRSQNKATLTALRYISAALKQQQIDRQLATISDEVALSILGKLAKQRLDSIEQFTVAKREDLVAQEQFELKLLQSYLPEALSETEIEEAITSAISEAQAKQPQDMGKVMALLKPRLQGRADLSQVSVKVKERLA